MKVEFLKARYYKGKLYNIGDIVEMERSSVRTYLNLKVVKISIGKIEIDLTKKTYKELQALCKQYKLPAVGKTEDLIISLTDILDSKKELKNAL